MQMCMGACSQPGASAHIRKPQPGAKLATAGACQHCWLHHRVAERCGQGGLASNAVVQQLAISKGSSQMPSNMACSAADSSNMCAIGPNLYSSKFDVSSIDFTTGLSSTQTWCPVVEGSQHGRAGIREARLIPDRWLEFAAAEGDPVDAAQPRVALDVIDPRHQAAIPLAEVHLQVIQLSFCHEVHRLAERSASA